MGFGQARGGQLTRKQKAVETKQGEIDQFGADKIELDKKIAAAKEEKAKLMQQVEELKRELDEAQAGEDAILVVPKGTSPQDALACFGGILPAELNQDQDVV